MCNQQIKDMGYAVLEDFLRPHEIEELKSCGQQFTKNLPPESERKIFDTINLQQVKLLQIIWNRQKTNVISYYPLKKKQ